MFVTVSSLANPHNLRVNIRYRDIRKLPPEVAAAMHQLTQDADQAGKAARWNPPKNADLIVTIIFTFTSRRVDVDAAEKRALDALAAGLNFNDNRVQELHLTKKVGLTPGVWAMVETIGDVQPDPTPEPTEGWFLVPGDPYPHEVL